MFQDIMVPETQDRIALRAHEIVTATVIGAVGVLVSVDFHDKPFFAAGEVCVVSSDRELSCEFVAAKFAGFQFKPKQSFGLIVTLSKFSGSQGSAIFAATAGLTSAFPHSVAASRRHLVSRRERFRGIEAIEPRSGRPPGPWLGEVARTT